MKTVILSTAMMTLIAGVATADTVRMGTEGAYAPYNYINDSGEIDGLEIELGNELCKRAELTCEWVVNDWDSIIPNLVSGNYDTIMATMAITPSRDEVIDFTQDYVPAAKSAFLAISDDVDPKNAVIAAQTGTIQANFVTTYGDATLVEFASADETIAAVRNGEADVVLADEEFLASFVAQSGGELMFVGDHPQIGGGVGMGIRESDAELKAKFNVAIESMKADGSLNALLIKWLGKDANIFE